MTFNVLIVEDEREFWAEPMQRALIKAAEQAKLDVVVDIALDAQSARLAMGQKFYHFLSLDQHLPEQQGEEMSIDKGLELSRLAHGIYPLSRFIAFTGRSDPREVVAIAQRMQTGPDNIWLKGVDFGAREWAWKVVEFLSKDYFSWYFAQARNYLPIPLAVASAKIAQHDYFYTRRADDVLPALRAMLDFWENTLHLAWLIGLARHRQAAGQGRPNAAEKEQQLARYLPELAALYPCGVWQTRTFLDASKQLRALRNRFAHSMGRDDGWRSELEAIKPAFKVVTDAAASWAGAPLIQGVYAHESEVGGLMRVKTQALKGAAWPWPFESLRLRNPNNVIKESEGVYACVDGNYETGFALLPLDGLLWVDYDGRFNRNRLFAFSHDGRPGERWKIDLESGQTSRCLLGSQPGRLM